MTATLAIYTSILNPSSNGNVHTYAATQELKEKILTVKRHNKKQAIEIQVTFIIEKKLQKVHFLAKKHCLLGKLCVHFEPLLGWQITYVCHD